MKLITEGVPIKPNFFRAGGTLPPVTVNFIFRNGGIGDYVGFLTSIVWIASEFPHVNGRLFVPRIFSDIPALALRPYSHWEVLIREDCKDDALQNHPTLYPLDKPINIIGAHPIDLGFMYFANLSAAPEEFNYQVQLPKEEMEFGIAFNNLADTNFVVLAVGSTAEIRTFPFKSFNYLKNRLVENDIVPVILGKSDLNPKVKTTFLNEYDFSHCLDLRDKTSLLDAAILMNHAKAVVGLDNGLLHVAAMTETPIVFGYNVASPLHRRPRRKNNKIFEIYPDPKVLSCTFCQSQMRFLKAHDFKHCIYGDKKCLDIIDDPNAWWQLTKDAIASKDNPA